METYFVEEVLSIEGFDRLEEVLSIHLELLDDILLDEGGR